MKTENINGFIWAVLDKDEAEELFADGQDVHEYCEKTGFYICLEREDISLAVSAGNKLVLEIGAKENLESDYHETVERNKENRTFEDWCLSKIE